MSEAGAGKKSVNSEKRQRTSPDRDSVVQEKVHNLKARRQGTASSLKHKRKELLDQLKEEPSSKDEIEKRFSAAETLYDNYVSFDKEYCRLLGKTEDADGLKEATFQSQEVEATFKELKDAFISWQGDIKQDDIQPDDSASQTGAKSVASRVSSTTSARVKATARKAALLAKGRALKQQQELQKKKAAMEMERQKREFEEQQRKLDIEAEEERLKLQAEIDAAVAEEEVLAEFERLSACNNQNQVTTGLNPNAQVWVPQRVNVQNTSNDIGNDVRNENNVDSFAKLLDVMKIPKTELKRFDGNTLDYYLFMNTFDETIGKTRVDDATKLAQLFQYCTGKALSVIECCAVMVPEQGYRTARELLKSRFGSDYQVSQAWVRRVCNRSNIKPSDNVELQNFADDLRSCKETICYGKTD